MKVTIAVAPERPVVKNGNNRGNSVETIQREIIYHQSRIEYLEKLLVAFQHACAHNLTLLKEEEFDVFNNIDGSQKLLARKDRKIVACCRNCLVVLEVRIFEMGVASCPKCFQKMIEDEAAPKPVLDMGDHIAHSFGSFQCERCDLSILIYIDTSD